MIPVIVVFIYLVIIAGIGLFAYKRGKANTEDFFLASRTIGPMVFFLSLFATNMTAFAILGSSGLAYRRGIGIYGLMASSSGFVIPLTIFFIGTRLWALGKKFGHQTQVQFFRARWECDAIGTLIFALSAAMLVPYMIISIMGGGTVLQEISTAPGGHDAMIPYWLGCAIVAIVVTVNVFFGGMRGTVWVNIFQTVLFLCFGFIAVMIINHTLGARGTSFSEAMYKLGSDPKTAFLLTRERMSQTEFWSYTLIPLSSIMFPHMAIMCFSARNVTAFKRTVVIYPVAILLIWLPCIFLGVIGVATLGKLTDPDGVLLRMLAEYAPVWLAGILGAGIISAVMGSDAHQVLAMSTMFTKDIYAHYGGHKKYGEASAVHFARGFILVVTVIAYLIALYLKQKQGIFEIAIRFAFSGFAAMAPVMIAALFWKRSTKWGALAATLFVAGTLALFAFLQGSPTPPPGTVAKPVATVKLDKSVDAAASSNATVPVTAVDPNGNSYPVRVDSTNLAGTVATGTDRSITITPAVGQTLDTNLLKSNPHLVATHAKATPGAPNKNNIIWQIGEGRQATVILSRAVNGDVRFLNGYMAVVPMVFGSAICMILFSLLTRPPSRETIDKYFSEET